MGNIEAVPTSTLYGYIANKKWDKAIERARTHPMDTTYRYSASDEEFDMSPLHLACHIDAPVLLICALIRANPESVSYLTTNGFTPLHIAIWRNASIDVVRTFLELAPGCLYKVGSEQGDDQVVVPSPIHLACGKKDPQWDTVELMIRWDPNIAALQSSVDECTPFHYAVICNAPTCILKCFVEVAPGSVSIQNNKFETPLHLLFRHPGNRLTAYMVESMIGCDENVLSLRNRRGDTPLHELCKTHNSPMKIFELLLKSCPEAASLRNFSGEVPAQIAASHSQPIDILKSLLLLDSNFYIIFQKKTNDSEHARNKTVDVDVDDDDSTLREFIKKYSTYTGCRSMVHAKSAPLLLI